MRWLGPAGEVIVRTPLPVLLALAMTAGFYAVTHAELTQQQRDIAYYVVPAALLASVAGQLMGGVLVAFILSAAAAAVAWFFEPLMVNRAALLAAAGVAVLVGPLIGRAQSAPGAWRRLVRQLMATVLALVGAVTVAGGVFVAEISVEELFGVNVDITRELVNPLAFGLLGPLVFLALCVRGDDPPDDRLSDAMGLVGQTFARLVLVPLLTIYAVVLAAYVARVLALGSLPSGEVGWIVPLFATTGAVTFLALASQPEPGWVTRTFLRVWFPLTIPAIALFAIALGIRVGAYGITPQRYLAILAGVWFTALALGFTFGGRRSDVRLIPVIGVLVLALGTLGPWSMVPVTVKSQVDQLVSLLPPGNVPATLRTMDNEVRRNTCSHVRILRDLGAVGPAEAALRVEEPGLVALCFEPFGSADPTIRVDFNSEADVLTLDDGQIIWGPITLRSGMETLTAQSVPLSMAMVGSTLVVSTQGQRETFDLAAAARAWQADPQVGDITLRAGDFAVVVKALHMLLAPEGPALRFARVVVISRPASPQDPPEPESEQP